jgi:pimeloyl-ACP methyl ester carboxylesterase
VSARILWVPSLAAVERNAFAEAVRDWAAVESFDLPREASTEAAVATAVARVDQLGWERYAIASESWGQTVAAELAAADADRVEAVALGHAAARFLVEGERAAVNPAVFEAMRQLLNTDYMAFARAVTQVSGGAITDEAMEAFVAAVPQSDARARLTRLVDGAPIMAARLHDVDVPILLGEHRGCFLWTHEGFEDAVAAVPHAQPFTCDVPPTLDPRFHDALRALIER